MSAPNRPQSMNFSSTGPSAGQHPLNYSVLPSPKSVSGQVPRRMSGGSRSSVRSVNRGSVSGIHAQRFTGTAVPNHNNSAANHRLGERV